MLKRSNRSEMVRSYLSESERRLIRSVQGGSAGLGAWIRRTALAVADAGHLPTGAPSIKEDEKARSPLSIRMSPEEARRIDDVRGSLPRSAWIREAAIRVAWMEHREVAG